MIRRPPRSTRTDTLFPSTTLFRAELFSALIGSGKPLVVDADALNIRATSPRKLQAYTVLTPHPGEAARLLSIKTHEVQADRRAAALALCERFGCVVVLKGAGTVVAAPGRIACIIDAGKDRKSTRLNSSH